MKKIVYGAVLVAIAGMAIIAAASAVPVARFSKKEHAAPVVTASDGSLECKHEYDTVIK